MTGASFALLLVLASGVSVAPAPSQSVIYFPSRDLCEAAAAQVRREIPGTWRHVCIPLVGSATR